MAGKKNYELFNAWLREEAKERAQEEADRDGRMLTQEDIDSTGWTTAEKVKE